jgi:queuine tRNA-ribosyltransferase
MPSRNARHGTLFTWEGVRILGNAQYKTDPLPIDPHCGCPTCQNYSRAYLRHLLAAKELLAYRLLVVHNLYFYNTLMERIRAELDAGTFDAFYREMAPMLDVRI